MWEWICSTRSERHEADKGEARLVKRGGVIFQLLLSFMPLLNIPCHLYFVIIVANRTLQQAVNRSFSLSACLLPCLPSLPVYCKCFNNVFRFVSSCFFLWATEPSPCFFLFPNFYFLSLPYRRSLHESAIVGRPPYFLYHRHSPP